MDTLEAVADNKTDSRVVAEANGLFISVNTFKFILLLIVMLEILCVVNALSQILQQKKQQNNSNSNILTIPGIRFGRRR